MDSPIIGVLCHNSVLYRRQGMLCYGLDAASVTPNDGRSRLHGDLGSSCRLGMTC